MRLINIICTDKESFKYSVRLYIYYYNIKKNRARVSELINNINPYIDIKFNEDSDIVQYERDNPHINLFIIGIDGNPVFLTRNNGSIQVTIVKLNDNRYSLVKPSIKRYMYNINEIKKDVCLRFGILNC